MPFIGHDPSLAAAAAFTAAAAAPTAALGGNKWEDACITANTLREIPDDSLQHTLVGRLWPSLTDRILEVRVMEREVDLGEGLALPPQLLHALDVR